MKGMLTLVTICLLGLSSARLASLDKSELLQDRETKSLNALMPDDSSLVGIDANGNIKKPDAGKDGHLEEKGHLLVFVIHRASAIQDVHYWNRVIDLVNKSYLGSGERIQYWGICDDAAGCNSYQPVAKFSILGCLDAYQMRIVAEADLGQEALLYNDSLRLAARIAKVADPSVESGVILDKVK